MSKNNNVWQQFQLKYRRINFRLLKNEFDRAVFFRDYKLELNQDECLLCLQLYSVNEGSSPAFIFYYRSS